MRERMHLVQCACGAWWFGGAVHALHWKNGKLVDCQGKPLAQENR